MLLIKHIASYWLSITLLFSAGFTVSAQDNPPNQPVEVFSDAPTVDNMTLSPAGTHIAFESLVDGNNFITIQTIDGKGVQQIGSPKNMFIQSFRWANEDVLLIVYYLRQKGKAPGGERLYAFDRKTEEFETVVKPDSQYVGRSVQYNTPRQGAILNILPDQKDKILMSLAPVRGTPPSVYEVDITNGSRESIYDGLKRYGFREFAANGMPWMAAGSPDTPRTRFSSANTPEEFRSLFKTRLSSDGQDWREASDTEFTFYSEAKEAGIMADGTRFTIGAYEGGASGVYTFSPSAPNNAVQLAAVPQRGVKDAIKDEFSGEVIGFEMLEPYAPDVYLDPKYAAAQNFAFSQIRGVAIDIVNKAKDKELYLIKISNDRLFDFYFIVDMDKKSISPLAQSRADAKSALLAPTNEYIVTTRDGLGIHVTLTRPQTTIAAPLVVMSMGLGDRVDRRAQPLRQFLASRGYAVLEVAPRGSDYSSELEQAVIGNLVGATSADIVDATRWAATQQGIDTSRSCVMGMGSTAGLFAMGAYQQASELYNCVINVNGYVQAPFENPGSFSTFQTWRGTVSSKHLLGYDDTLIMQNSPLDNTEKFKDPALFIGIDELTRNKIFFNLKKMSKDVSKGELITLKRNDFQSVANPEHRKAIYSGIEKFLKKNIK